ncbi:DMT family transporter [Patescibacteria group bacterium]|nr:DMT family transporter [Patescibacteria group bacterium]
MSYHRKRAYLYLVIVAIIWGVASPIIKFTLGGIDPLPFLTYRFAIAASFSIAFFAIKGIKLSRLKKNLPLIILYGLLAFPIALGTLFVGLDKSTVLDVTIINTIGPLVVALGGAYFFKEHITKREKIGIAIVVIGGALNALAPILVNNSNARLTGNLFIIAFLLSDSTATLLAKKIVKKKISPLTLTNLGFIVGAVTIIPFALLTQGAENLITSIIYLPFKYHLGVWYMALISGTLAYFLYVAGQKSIEVSEAVLFNYLQPIFTIPLAIFWLGETITPTFIIGAVLITAGIVIAERKTISKKGIASKTSS